MLNVLDAWIDEAALPFWADRGFNHDLDLFYERLDRYGEPLAVPYRAMVQARQIYTFAHAGLLGVAPDGADRADRAFRRLRRSFAQTGNGQTRFVFSIDPAGGQHHSTALDSYTHAFVLLAIAYLYRLGGEPALPALADSVTLFLDRAMTDAVSGGVIDSLPSPPAAAKRQNPQMHLLEAFLALEEAMPGRGYAERAGTLVSLFDDRLFKPQIGVLLEHFAADWSPHAVPDRACVVEPGHHYEWVWLLERYQQVAGIDTGPQRDALWRSAQLLGHGEGGLIHDEIAPDGRIVSAGHRLWPHTEAIKAAATMHRAGDRDAAGFANRMADRLLTVFLGKPFPGGWIDHFEPDLTPRVEYVPASSLYHLFLASAEARHSFTD